MILFDIVRRLAVFFYAGEDDNVKTFWFREPVGYFVQQEIFLIMKGTLHGLAVDHCPLSHKLEHQENGSEQQKIGQDFFDNCKYFVHNVSSPHP